jgi:hypothetical protein
MWRGWWRICALGALALLAVTPSAIAAQRFASPDGAGDCTTSSSPCGYESAITGAGNGDEVILAPGDYGSALVPRTAVVYSYLQLAVHGVAGQPRPRIFSSSTFPLGLANAASTISHIDIERVATSAGAALEFHGTLADDMTVTDAGGAGSAACRLNGSAVVLRTSRCYSNAGSGGSGVLVNSGLPGGATGITLRGVTAVANGAGASGVSVSAPGINATVTLVNTIAEGIVDVYAGGTGAGTAVVGATYSQFHINQQDPGGTINSDATDVYPYPAFVDFPGADFHQTAESSTVDKGIDDPLNGTTDWDGQPRTAGAHTDIGADEYIAPAPPVIAPPAPPVTPAVPVTPAKPPATPAGEPLGLKASSIVTLPALKSCASRRSFKIRLRAPKGVTITSATVLVSTRKAKVVKGRALTAPVDLRGLPKGRFTVKITIVTGTKRSLTAKRAYKTCVPKRH